MWWSVLLRKAFVTRTVICHTKPGNSNQVLVKLLKYTSPYLGDVRRLVGRPTCLVLPTEQQTGKLEMTEHESPQVNSLARSVALIS